MKRAGKLRLIAARAIVTMPSSSGCRSTSSTLRGNSGSSSRNSSPLCASETSPGRGIMPPPISPASEMVWCGERNGRCVTSPCSASSTPATEWILVVSSASSKLSGARIDGSRLASMVFPEPGGPIIRMLWPPAAATSSARLATCCPRTSLKSKGKCCISFSSCACLDLQCGATGCRRTKPHSAARAPPAGLRTG
jgi:hypothetical protein